MTTIARRFIAALLPLGLALWAGSASAQIKINEIRTDHTGTDTDEYFELKGSPGASLAGLTYVVIGDASTAPTCGAIECVVDLGTFSIQADGLLCLRNSATTPVLTGYDGAVALVFENSDNVTHLLVSGFTGALGQDLDTNDDGVLDVTPWSAIVDGVGLNKGTVADCITEEYLYYPVHVGPDGAFVPGHVYRYSDTQVWAIGVFALGTTDTPGAPNFSQFQPPPLYADMSREPCVPLTGQPATVIALVRNNPTSAELRYRVNGGAETALPMDVYGTSGDTVYFFTQIPAQATNGTLVEYYCNSWNANPNPTRSTNEGYFVGTKTVADLRVNDVNGNNRYRYYGARVRGHVTAAYGVFGTVNTDYQVQDATGGINIFKFGPHLVHPALGDDITAAGALDQYNGKLELSATGSCDTVLVTIHGPGTPPAPLPLLRVCDLREEHEGLLVRVQNLLINTYGDPTFVGNRNYKAINCLQDSFELRIDADTNIPGNAISSNHLEVVGIAGQFDTSPPYTWWYQVQPRAMSDITFLGPTDVPAAAGLGAARLWPGAPNPFSGTAEIQYEVPASPTGAEALHVRLRVFDLIGRAVATLVDGPVPPGVHSAKLDRSALEGHGSGIFFYRLEVSGVVLTRKLAMIRP